jgi:uncharacterized damage-inducible protein DinB
MAARRLAKGKFDEYYKKYVSKVKGDPMEYLKKQEKELAELLKKVNKKNLEYAYAEGKWSLKEVLVHMIDSEQIFAYRALAIARGEKKALPGYDQNKYIKNANLEHITKKQIAENFKSIRKSSMFLFDTFGPEDWVRVGKANGSETSASAIPYIIGGHAKHHMDIIKKKYLK